MSLGLARDSILNLAEYGRNAGKLENEKSQDADDDNFLSIEDKGESPQEERNAVTFQAGVAYSQELPSTNTSHNDVNDVQKNDALALKHSEALSRNNPDMRYSSFYGNEVYNNYYNEATMSYGFYDPYGASYSQSPKPGLLKLGKNKNIFCCLFTPWLRIDGECADDDEEEESSDYGNHAALVTGQRSKFPDDTVKSKISQDTENNNYVASESDSKTHSASSKRSILPTNTYGTKQPSGNDKAEAIAIPKSLSGMKLAEKQNEKKQSNPSHKGILKQCGLQKQFAQTQTNQSNGNRSKKIINNHRRLLFPVYDQNSVSQHVENSDDLKLSSKNVTFAKMARVMTISARADMSFMSKSLIWWQRSDYEEFKKTGRIIAKAMLQGGSEIWLQTSDAWGKKQQEEKKSQGSHSEEYSQALRSYGGSEEIDEETGGDLGNKWWCKFGHSRRGLEHIVTVEEGRQRHQNVNMAISAVMDEQKVQRINRSKDSKKLAQVYMSYTHWARDLALAAGTADAHAVSSNFTAGGKCRSYFLRNAMTSQTRESLRHTLNEPSLAAILDANTKTNLLLKQQNNSIKAPRKPQSDDRLSNKTSVPASNNKVGEHSNMTTSNIPGFETVHDPLPSKEYIAKKAAGFSADGECEISMAAVLSGLGTMGGTNRASTIGAH